MTSIETINSLQENIAIKNKEFINTNSLVLDQLSYIYQIIQPNINSTILNENEKKSLQSALYVMLDSSLKLLQNPIKQVVKKKLEYNAILDTVEIEYTPMIERLLLFYHYHQPVIPIKRLTNKVRVLIQTNYEYTKNIRQTMLLADENERNNEQITVHGIIDNNVISAVDSYKNYSHKRKQVSSEEDKFVYKYQEGINNAVKYTVKLGFFFNN